MKRNVAIGVDDVTNLFLLSLYDGSAHANNYFPPADFSFCWRTKLFRQRSLVSPAVNFERPPSGSVTDFHYIYRAAATLSSPLAGVAAVAQYSTRSQFPFVVTTIPQFLVLPLLFPDLSIHIIDWISCQDTRSRFHPNGSPPQ